MARLNVRAISFALMVAVPCAASILISYPSFRSERIALQHENLMWRAKSLAYEASDSIQTQRVKGEWVAPTKDVVIDTGITRLPVADEVFAFVDEAGKLMMITVDPQNKVMTRTGDVQRTLDAYGVRAGFIDSHGVGIGLVGATLNKDELKQISAQQQREGSILLGTEWITYHEIPKTNLIAVITAPQKTLQSSYERRIVLISIIGVIFTVAAALSAGLIVDKQRRTS